MLQLMLSGKVKAIDTYEEKGGEQAAAFCLMVGQWSKLGGKVEHEVWVYCPAWMNARVGKLVKEGGYIGVMANEFNIRTIKPVKGDAIGFLQVKAADLFIL